MARVYTRKHLHCSVEGCNGRGCGKGSKYFSKGFCRKHYARLLRHGDIDLHLRIRRTEKLPCSVPDCDGISNRVTPGGFCSMHQYRKNKYGSPTAEVTHHAEKATQAEYAVRSIFLQHGHKAIRPRGRDDCDLLIDGTLKIDVKCAEIQKRKSRNDSLKWVFNIHRHGVLKEKSDYYIFQFLGVPGQRSALYAAYKSPLGCYTSAFSLRSMIRTLAPAVELYESLIQKPAKTEVAA